MPRSLRAYLWDIERAVSDILTFTCGKQLGEYENDAMLRAAVERNFEVIGEALSQALRCPANGRSHNRRATDHRVPQPSYSRICNREPRAGVGHRPDESSPASRRGRSLAERGRRRERLM
jgi:hypothetical protein